jgi:hypothetical protein
MAQSQVLSLSGDVVRAKNLSQTLIHFNICWTLCISSVWGGVNDTQASSEVPDFNWPTDPPLYSDLSRSWSNRKWRRCVVD